MRLRVLIVLGEKFLKRLARFLKTLLHKVAVGQEELSLLRAGVSGEDLFGRAFGIRG